MNKNKSLSRCNGFIYLDLPPHLSTLICCIRIGLIINLIKSPMINTWEFFSLSHRALGYSAK